MRITITAIMMLTGSLLASAQKCKKCDMNADVDISDRVQKNTYSQIQSFLCTFDEQCRSNVEFSEFSNEHLFKVIEAYPQVFIQVLQNVDDVKQRLILDELEVPIHDGFDLELIYAKLSQIEESNAMLEKVKASIGSAVRKSGAEIKE